MNKKNRDEFWKGLSKEGQARLRRTSARNQLMHPVYVDDYTEETGVSLTRQDKGFGNTIYRTYFSVIYMIEKKWF